MAKNAVTRGATPGRWKVDGVHGRVETIRAASYSDVCIAIMPHWHDAYLEELEDNARLIAAAWDYAEAGKVFQAAMRDKERPDMLALIRALEMVD